MAGQLHEIHPSSTSSPAVRDSESTVLVVAFFMPYLAALFAAFLARGLVPPPTCRRRDAECKGEQNEPGT
jgi:hypothetical protein